MCLFKRVFTATAAFLIKCHSKLPTTVGGILAKILANYSKHALYLAGALYL